MSYHRCINSWHFSFSLSVSMSMYIHTGNVASTLGFPFNRGGDFIVQLPKTLYLDGIWYVALVDLTLVRGSDVTSLTTPLHVCLDFVESSIVGNSSLQTLGAFFTGSTNFTASILKLKYIKLTTNVIQSFRLTLHDFEGEIHPLTDSDHLFISLHLSSKKMS